ncbi:MAG: hypothetical protein JXA19_07285 [Anaerolineales bacterium]|nr:hypothetical protein [Anaerolineales bacterium]
MPAIELSRLRQQAAAIAINFGDPVKFIRDCDTFFEYYSDRTQRPGQKTSKNITLDSYHVPIQVIRRIIFELTPLCESEPNSGLQLAKSCWGKDIFEYYTLSANILGLLPISEKEMILRTITHWIGKGVDDSVLQLLAEDALAKIREDDQNYLMSQTEKWLLPSEQISLHIFALITLKTFLDDSDFDILPTIYHLLGDFLSHLNKQHLPYVLKLIKSLVSTSPQETAFFMNQSYLRNPNTELAWILRQSLNAYPTEIQKMLRETLAAR